MMDTAEFFACVRAKLGGGHFSQEQVDGLDSILVAASGAPLSHTAYMLATAWHETNTTLLPVREAYWLSEDWRKRHLKYYPWYGRGFVQLTWIANYRKADRECANAGLTKLGQILADPDLVMRVDVASHILRRGMTDGWFTGASMKKLLPLRGVATREQYMHARTIINGRDKADLVEDYAQVFERGLRDGGW